MQLQSKKLTLVNQGSNSEIYRYGCKQKGVVLKMVSPGCAKQSKHLSNEFKVLRSLDHENIMKVLKYKERIMINGKGGSKQLQVERNVLVVENACHGSLLDFYREYPPSANQTRWIVSELCEAVRYLHCNYIVHRDIKLNNVMVGQNESQIQIKLGDFGFATHTHNSPKSNSIKGTKRAYMAPEIHNLYKEPEQNYDMFKADIFALGVVMFSLVFGMLPFEYANPTNHLYALIQQNKFEEFWRIHIKGEEQVREAEGGMVEEFKTIFQLMVQGDPNKRPTIQEVIDSDWFSGKQQIIKSIHKQPDCTN